MPQPARAARTIQARRPHAASDAHPQPLQAFSNESKLIDTEELEDHLPRLIDISEVRHEVRAPNGRRLPPYMVLPRGEPLDLFICSRRPDALHCVMVRTGKN